VASPIKQPLPIQTTRIETSQGAPGNFNALASQIQSAPPPINTTPGFVAPQLVGVDVQTPIATVPALSGGATGVFSFSVSFTGLPQNFRIIAGQAVFLDVAVALARTAPTTYVFGIPVIAASFGAINAPTVQGPNQVTSPTARITIMYFSAATQAQTQVPFSVRATLYGTYTAGL
jgi:hypothetical protein